MVFRISFWDEYTGDPAADLGVACATEADARTAANISWDECLAGNDQPSEALKWDGPLASATYLGDHGRTYAVKYWVHAA